jgi:hypothetical protein
MQASDVTVDCARCARPVCNSVAWEEGPDNCPRRVMPDTHFDIYKEPWLSRAASLAIDSFSRYL